MGGCPDTSDELSYKLRIASHPPRPSRPERPPDLRWLSRQRRFVTPNDVSRCEKPHLPDTLSGGNIRGTQPSPASHHHDATQQGIPAYPPHLLAPQEEFLRLRCFPIRHTIYRIFQQADTIYCGVHAFLLRYSVEVVKSLKRKKPDKGLPAFPKSIVSLHLAESFFFRFPRSGRPFAGQGKGGKEHKVKMKLHNIFCHNKLQKNRRASAREKLLQKGRRAFPNNRGRAHMESPA